jgi:hypothetical protein
MLTALERFDEAIDHASDFLRVINQHLRFVGRNDFDARADFELRLEFRTRGVSRPKVASGKIARTAIT